MCLPVLTFEHVHISAGPRGTRAECVMPALTFVHHCSVFKEPLPDTRRYPTVAAGGESELTPIPYCGSLVPGSRTTEVVTSRPPGGPKEGGRPCQSATRSHLKGTRGRTDQNRCRSTRRQAEIQGLWAIRAVRRHSASPVRDGRVRSASLSPVGSKGIEAQEAAALAAPAQGGDEDRQPAADARGARGHPRHLGMGERRQGHPDRTSG